MNCRWNVFDNYVPGAHDFRKARDTLVQMISDVVAPRVVV
jgi:hypothetical protein